MRALQILAITLLTSIALPLLAVAGVNEATLPERAAAWVENLSDPNAHIAKLDEQVRLAREGEYGPMNRARLAQLQTSRNKIERILRGKISGKELPMTEQLKVFTQQQRFTAALENANKDRIVCKRVAATGTRLAKAQCMTLAQREERARVAREGLLRVQRELCVPGEGQACR